MTIATVTKEDKTAKGTITLNGSKSIANRALIIRALCEEDFPIHKLSNSKDTVLMDSLLKSNTEVRDAGAAGTTFRFMTAYLAMQPGTQILTGTERMKQRPIGVLVDALRKLGANIEYIENEGYPPLKIHSPSGFGHSNQVTISAGTSSQYISALLMIAPTLPNGLELILDGEIVSRPYIEMTLNLMSYFSVLHQWDGNTIKVAHQKYQARPFTVEADWSGASYYYAIAAFAEEVDLQLNGLFEKSVQGDSVLVQMMEQFGIQSIFNEEGVHLSKMGTELPPVFEWDFIRCPDLAQTMAVVCGGLGVQGLFSGLQTLRIKETDRIAALQNELAKVQVYLSLLPKRFSQKSDKEYFMIDGKAVVDSNPTFPTYEDHRQAMAIAPLAQFGQINVEEPEVVGKSYPQFWEDISKLGFVVKDNVR
ncbi:MAG: 3-phosphoshikimate 1-carboxyvinyltransferase [Bacteroidota bacterium]